MEEDYGSEQSLGWRRIIIALVIQTVLAGMSFYSATARWQAQIEERIAWIKTRQDENFAEHALLIERCREIIQTTHGR